MRTILGGVAEKAAMQESSPMKLSNGRAPPLIIGKPSRRVSVQIHQSRGVGEFSVRPPPPSPGSGPSVNSRAAGRGFENQGPTDDHLDRCRLRAAS